MVLHLAARQRISFVAQEHSGNTMPAKSPRLSVTLTDKQMSIVQRLADKSRVSRSWVVSQAVVEFLEKNIDLQVPLPVVREARR